MKTVSNGQVMAAMLRQKFYDDRVMKDKIDKIKHIIRANINITSRQKTNICKEINKIIGEKQ